MGYFVLYSQIIQRQLNFIRRVTYPLGSLHLQAPLVSDDSVAPAQVCFQVERAAGDPGQLEAPVPLESLLFEVELLYFLETTAALYTLEDVTIHQLLLVGTFFQTPLKLMFRCKPYLSSSLIRGN